MGDAVNLASRIEGVNKVYGTVILVSEAAAATAQSAIRFREIDTVRVKGKQAGTTIYSPCDDETLITRSAGALAAYRAGNFGESRRLWQEIAGAYPQDPVALVFLARLARFEAGAPAQWDGITTLEEK
jgi:adenylate cyclase